MGLSRQRQLQALCDVWRGRLRMDDWRIVARLVPDTEMDENERGAVVWDPDTMTATIRVNANMTPDYDGNTPSDEVVLLHEIIHAMMPPVKGAAKRIQERGINMIAEALVFGWGGVIYKDKP